jgi:hypothetical protein
MRLAVSAYFVSAGFLDDFWRDSLSISGFLVTTVGVLFALVGIIVAIGQIRRIATNAQAAAEASKRTQATVTKMIDLTSLGSGLRLISEIEELVKGDRFDAAALKMKDLRGLMVELRMSRGGETEVDTRFQRAVTLVASFQDSLLRRHYSPDARLDPMAMHRRLNEISDFLTGLVAAGRLEGGG